MNVGWMKDMPIVVDCIVRLRPSIVSTICSLGIVVCSRLSMLSGWGLCMPRYIWLFDSSAQLLHAGTENLLINVISSRKVFWVASDVNFIFGLVDTYPIYTHGRWKRKVFQVHISEVL